MRRFVILFGLPVLMAVLPVYGGLNDGLVSHWTFDETSGTIAHDSAGTNDGALNGGPQWTAGKIGGALYFDGVNDYVNCGNDSSLDIRDNITISLWYNSTAWTTKTGGVYVNGLISKRDLYIPGQTGFDWEIYYNNYLNGICLWDSAIPTFNIMHIAPATNTWQHLVVTKNGTTASLYLDGILRATDATSALWDTGDSVRIGICAIDWPPDRGFFFGAIDDVRIYNRVLSTNEVAQLYSIPEPATLLLLGLGGVLLRRRQ